MYLLHIRGPRIESPWAAYSPAVPFSQWLPPEIIISLYIEKNGQEDIGRQWAELLFIAAQEDGNLMICFYLTGRQRKGRVEGVLSEQTHSFSFTSAQLYHLWPN